jgi:peptidoglycan/LPS O-acetylase OafA/YrhL
LFFCFIYHPSLLSFLENKLLMSIGVSSYFLYLLHEYVGVVWIRNFVSMFYSYSFMAPSIMTVIMIIVSIFYTLKIEPKITFGFKNYLLKK